MFVGVGAKRVRDVFEMARVVFTHIFFWTLREGEGGQSGSKGGCKKVPPIWRVPIYESNGSFVCSWLFFTVPVQRISQGGSPPGI